MIVIVMVMVTMGVSAYMSCTSGFSHAREVVLERNVRVIKGTWAGMCGDKR